MSIPKKMSISGITSLASFFGLLDAFDSPSISISVETGFVNEACSRSTATSRDFAAGLVDGYVSVITCARISGVRRLRMEEIDRSARRENLASNNVTARSSKGKLLLISVRNRQVLADESAEENG